MRKVKDIIFEMENFAPNYLKEDFDNVGLMVGDREKDVNRVILALDCTLDVIEEAKENKADLIITHHPLIFRKPSNITTDTLQGKKIIELIKNDISLYSSHTNLDSSLNGLNHTIAKLLGFNESKVLSVNKNDPKAGLGRMIDLNEEKNLDDIIKLVKNNLNISNLRVVRGKNKVSKIAIINGSGQDFIFKAMSKGSDCIITGDTTYHFASDYKEMGISILDVGHFSSEWLVFLKVMENITDKFSDIEFIASKTMKDPYEFY